MKYLSSFRFLILFLSLLGGCTHQNESDIESFALLIELPVAADAEKMETDQIMDSVEQRLSASHSIQRWYRIRSEQSVGGIYFIDGQTEKEDLATDWIDKITSSQPNRPTVQIFRTPVQTSGAAPDITDTNSVVAIVGVTAPWYAPARMITNRMSAAIPVYRDLNGLSYKHFTITGKRQVGGIYLWQSRSAAEAFYDQEWQTRILEQYGEPATLKWFSVAVP